MSSTERPQLPSRRSHWSGRRVGRKEAVALAYDPEKDSAPRVVARGQGHMAEAIVTRAQEHGVTVVTDKVALEALRFVDIGEEVPPNVYHMVAQVLAFVYNLGQQPRDPR